MKKFITLKNKFASFGNPRSGISLVEVIVSIALLGIVMICICQMLMTGLTILSVNQRKTKNAYNTAGAVGTGSTVSDVTTTSAPNRSATVTIDGTTTTIPGTYVNGGTGTGTPNQYSVSEWTFNPD